MGELTLEQKKALARARAKLKIQAGTKTGVVEQGGSGLVEGVAGFLGTPVDMMTGAINAMRPPVVDLPLNPDGSVGKPTFTERPPLIERPIGGSERWLETLDPLISDTPPQTTGQGYARRIGQEFGFGVPAALTFAAIPGAGAAARANMPAYMAANAAGDLGSAMAGETAEMVLPESKIAQIAASLFGGVAGARGVSMMMPGPKASSLDAAKAAETSKWEAVRTADAPLAPGVSDELINALKARVAKERATNPNLFPRANATIDDIAAIPPKSVYEIEEARRLAGRNVAANADESRVGVGMKDEISAYLDSLTPQKVQGADPEGIVADLKAARDLSHRVKKAEIVMNKEMRGESAAATSGTGGNTVNTTRQKLRTVFDNERDPTLSGKKAGFTPEEMAQMERAVMGTGPQNFARLVGRLSPSSGLLPLAMGGGAVGAGATGFVTTGNPLSLLLAVPPSVGMIGKGLAEHSTKKEIAKLLETILAGAPLGPSSAQSASRAAIVQQLLASPVENRPQ